MTRIPRLVVVVMGAMVVFAGCVGAQPTPTPIPSPTPGPAPEGYLLRATVVQALPPDSYFGWFPHAAITNRLELLEALAVPAIFPGPLMPSYMARMMTQRGYARIVDEARALGLLTGRADFTAPNSMMPGAALGRIELVADGRRYDFTGDPSLLVRCDGARCVPDPGTPEAFAAFWQRLGDLNRWLAGELAPGQSYVPPAYSLLVEAPSPTDGLAPRFATWPLAQRLSTAGAPIGPADLPRCVTIRGADADAVRPVLGAADQLTRFVDAAGGPDGGLSLRVRPLLLGEDHCKELFGLDT